MLCSESSLKVPTEVPVVLISVKATPLLVFMLYEPEIGLADAVRFNVLPAQIGLGVALAVAPVTFRFTVITAVAEAEQLFTDSVPVTV